MRELTLSVSGEGIVETSEDGAGGDRPAWPGRLPLTELLSAADSELTASGPEAMRALAAARCRGRVRRMRRSIFFTQLSDADPRTGRL